MWGWLGWLITFSFINVTWVFFRATDLTSAKRILAGMAGMGGVVLPTSFANIPVLSYFFDRTIFSGVNLIPLTFAVSVLFLTIFINNSLRITLESSYRKRILLFIVIIFISLPELHKVSEFLYFNF
jgi:hypothetical protein